jgi:phage-related protein
MQMQSSAQEIVGRLQKQSERVDYMITGFLDTVDRAGGFVSNVVSKPVQQISNILRAVKAIVESLRTPPPPRRPAPPAGDDRFV